MTPREQQIGAHTAYTDWLSSADWGFFLTITDPGMSHPEHMLKATRYVINSLNRKIYGRNYWKRGDSVESVIGLERQKRGSVHSHSLIRMPSVSAGDPYFDALGFLRRTCDKLDGWTKVERPRNPADVVGYVTKYVCKGGEIYLSQNLDPYIPQIYSETLLGRAEA